MKKAVSLLVAALVLGCGPEVEVPGPDGGGGSGGVGGHGSGESSSSASSSSSSSGQPTCDTAFQIGVCEDCKAKGCPMADPKDPDLCHYGAVVMYTDMIGCLQWPGPQSQCPACKDITANMPITPECESCAKPFTPCSLNCAYELTGGMGGSPP